MMRRTVVKRTGKALAVTLLLMLSLSPALLASCGGQQQAPAPAFSPERVAALDQALDDFMAAAAFPGLIVGIWAPDEGTYVATRGLASTDPERANGRGDLLQPETHEVRLTWTDLEDPPAGMFMHGYGIVYDHGFLGFHGAYAGFQSTSMYLPERDAVMVILSNDMADLNAPNLLFNRLAEIAFPEEHLD